MLHPTQIRRVSRLLYVLLTSGDILLKLSFLKIKVGFVCQVAYAYTCCIPTLKASFWLYVYRNNPFMARVFDRVL